MTPEETAAAEAEKIQAQAAQDQDAKSKYGAVRVARNVDKNGNDIVAYFREPSRPVLGVAIAELDKNTVLACEYIFDDACIREISDFDAFRNDVSIFLGLGGMLQSLIIVKKSTFTTL